MGRWLILFCVLGLAAIASPAASQDRALAITEFYVYPDDITDFNKLAGFNWPDVKQLNALVRIELAGFSGEERMDIFMVVQDADADDETVIAKQKLKFFLPPGEHDCVFPEFITTEGYFGERRFKLTVEASLKGTQPVYDELYFELTGPNAPEVDILEVEIFNPEPGAPSTYFRPGDEFGVDALIEIEGNESDIAPDIIFFAMMEEDAHLIDPELNYQPYDRHWASRPLDDTEGVFSIRAFGRLPYFFYDPYDFRHDFRVYAIVDFGPGNVVDDYARSELWDYNTGDHRYSDDLLDRLIEMDRGHMWLVRRLRGGSPDTGRFWD